jgi:polyribonucleotide nucleotidyltransferase
MPQYETGGMDIVVAGTADAVMMVEGGGNEISEDEFLGAVEYAHGEIKKIVAAIDKLAKKAGKAKREFPLLKPDPALAKWVEKTFKDDVATAMRVSEKGERNAAFAKLTRAEALVRLGDKKPELAALISDPKRPDFDKIIKAMEEEELRVMVVDDKIRPDGRKPDEIRPIWSKVHYVPRVHGSGVFTRGQTQVFTAATLGSIGDEQRLDGIMAIPNKRYMHYYNFPPYSTGEARPRASRDRSRRVGRARDRADAAERGRVPLHAAPHQRSARVERFVVDGVGVR